MFFIKCCIFSTATRKQRGKREAAAQVSIEYLILLSAFFAALAVFLPVASDTTQSFLSAGDDLLAKNISDSLTEQRSLFSFLGDGSSKTLEFVPAKSIVLYSSGNEVVIESKNKQFRSVLPSPQFIVRQEFNSKFFLTIKKTNGKIEVSVSQS